MPDDYEIESPESIDRALDAQERERAAFTIDTGIPLNEDGRLELPSKKKPDGETSGSTDTFVR